MVSHSSSLNSNGENGNNNMQAPPSSSNTTRSLRTRRRYMRHNSQQKRHMEAFFRRCPHPNDAQREELAKLLGLEPTQVKFWFQNKRTQSKNHLERTENDQLKHSNIELRSENDTIREILSKTTCRECGGLTHPQLAFEYKHIKAENDHIRGEIERVKKMMNDLVISGTPNPNMSSQVNTQHETSLNQGVGNVTCQHNNMPETLLNQGAVNVPSQDDNMPPSLLYQELSNLPSQDTNIPASLLDQGLDNLPSLDFNDMHMLESFLNQGDDNLQSQDNAMPMNLVNQGLDNLVSHGNDMLITSAVNQGPDNMASQNNGTPSSFLNQGLDNSLSQDDGMLMSVVNQGHGNGATQDNDIHLSWFNEALDNQSSQDIDMPPSLINHGLDNPPFQGNHLQPSLVNQGLDNLPFQGVGHESPQHNYMPPSSLSQEIGNMPSQHNHSSSLTQGVGDMSSPNNDMVSSFFNQEIDNMLSDQDDNMLLNVQGIDNTPSHDVLPSSFTQELDNVASQQNNMPPSLHPQEIGNIPSQQNSMPPSSHPQEIGNIQSQQNNMPPSSHPQEIGNVPSQQNNMPLSSLTQGNGDMSSKNNDMLSSFFSQGIDNMSSQDDNVQLCVQGIDSAMFDQNEMPLSSINEGAGSQPGIVGQMNGGDGNPLRSSPPVLSENSDKPIIMELAIQSMEELARMAQEGQSLWVRGKYSADILNELEYFRTSPGGIGPKLLGFRSESSRESMVVSTNHINLIEILMDVDQWSRVFCGIVSRASILEVISKGLAGSYDGCMQVMSAEFHAPSPLVPPRECYFIRYCKQLPGGSWAVVDVSLDNIRPRAKTFSSRRRPSGCLIEPLPYGFSTKVTWVEHVEVDDRKLAPQPTYVPFVESTLAFGARRWISSLNRQCERIGCTLATTIPPRRLSGILTNREGRKGLLRLAERIVMSFFSGAGASTSSVWTTLSAVRCFNNMRIVARKDKNEAGIPFGIVICASTCFRLAVPLQRAFNCIRNENLRNEWDVLAIGGNAEEFTHIEMGRDPANCVSLFRVKSSNPLHNNLIIVQETVTDSTGSLVVYAPIDVVSYNKILDGKPPDSLPVLPAGFAILPDVGSEGCLVTVAFQILMEPDIAKSISLHSLTAVNTLINNTVGRIKAVAMTT